MMAGGGGVMGSMLSGIAGGSNSGSGSRGVSSVILGLGGFNTDLELARHLQQNAGIEDPEQARQTHNMDLIY